jgi:hypothetical protein
VATHRKSRDEEHENKRDELRKKLEEKTKDPDYIKQP